MRLLDNAAAMFRQAFLGKRSLYWCCSSGAGLILGAAAVKQDIVLVAIAFSALAAFGWFALLDDQREEDRRKSLWDMIAMGENGLAAYLEECDDVDGDEC